MKKQNSKGRLAAYSFTRLINDLRKLTRAAQEAHILSAAFLAEPGNEADKACGKVPSIGLMHSASFRRALG
ncbi:hypothetical protein [Rhizobium mesosinicum]|uniref:Uncharacterized protein n=1 Tax=Rhizobium mesosinicum TaxID=335017 RepID=A0ABS7GUB7_9HYPH|nr:hypothetical protein [Rhizobium mesosinicum]MBW9053553.1 hypothetical protein [Rhizobium mesosinicum]